MHLHRRDGIKASAVALLAASCTLVACGDSGSGADAGGADAATTADGGSTSFGTLTANGPRTSGHDLGRITVGAETGEGFDHDNDGRADEIDLDGDGVSDGEDVDGDGTITVWRDLAEGEVPDPHPEQRVTFTDTSLYARLDPMGPVLSNSSAGGGVTLPSSAMNELPAGVLRARSQGTQGSCAAFTVAAAATLVRYRYQQASMPAINADAFWASPAWLYARMLRDLPGTCNGGTSIIHGLNTLVSTGSATWAEQPYRSGDMPTVCETIDATTARTPDAYRIGGYTTLPANPAKFRLAARESVAAGLPVVFGVNLPTGFGSFRATTAGVDVTSVYRGTGMCTDSVHCGGHAMVIVGYDDARQAYRVLNSWGTDWGDAGYLWWDFASLEALPNLQGGVMLPFPSAPPALGAPNATTFAIAPPAGGQPVLVAVTENGATTWTLRMRVVASEPLTLTALTAEINGNGFVTNLSSTVSYGDVVFNLPGDGMPAAGTAVNLTFAGTLRDGTAVTRMLTATTPAPTAL